MKALLKKLFAKLGLEVQRTGNTFLYPLIQLDAKLLPVAYYFERMFQHIKTIPGDIVECGIGYSRTFQLLALLTQAEGRGRTLWGFDSFQGFPEPTPEDASPRNPKKGEWKVITVADLKQILHLIRLTPEFIAKQVKVSPGFFDTTLPKAPIKDIALLHLDVDLYGSYQTCLKELFPKVVPGGVVLFDEYGSDKTFPGARKAIDEYFSSIPHEFKQDSGTGKYYVIKGS